MSKEELIEKTNNIISELVKAKPEIQKAYNYYAGIRDAEQYRYLEENYGVGNSTNVEFTPFVKKHIDALIGEFLGVPIIPKITCKDSKTISNITRDKQLTITKKVYEYLLLKISNSILKFLNQLDPTDINIKQQLDELVEDLQTGYISEYEAAALNVVQYILQDRRTDIYTKLRHLFLDLLIAGYCYFRCIPSQSNRNVDIEVLDPRNTFIERNPESVYVKHSPKAVVRKWYNKELILNKYGRDLKAEDVKTIRENWNEESREAGGYYIKGHPGHSYSPHIEGLDYGIEALMGVPYDDFNYTYNVYDLIPVYEVEWVETDSHFTMKRYQTIRIGEHIYILKGEDDNVIRTQSDPTACSLSINGIYFTNRSSKPYSLMLTCIGLQDRYDLLIYIKNSILANSGTVGDYIDTSLLPTWLGTDPVERILKYLGYKKIGIAPIDTSQEGRLATGQAPINTIFNGFDNTVKADAIQAIVLCIQQLEELLSSITGVFRERLLGIELRDAVTNVKLGVQNSYMVTKQYYQLMDIAVSELLTDALNIAKIVYKNGLTGTLILGDKLLQVFTALPKHFTLSDWDVHISTSTELIKDLETIRLLIPELLRGLAISPEIVFEAVTAKSMTELKTRALASLKKLKKENNLLGQLQLQVLQLELQLQQTLNELKLAQSKVELLNEQKLQIESLKVLSDLKIAWYEALTDRVYKNKKNEIDEQKVKIELAQLNDGNPYNDEVKY